MDNSEQTSDRARQPLNESQILCAALDAEVLLAVHERLGA